MNSEELFYPVRPSAGFPTLVYQYNHETLFNLTDQYYVQSTYSYCVPADTKSLDLTIPCLDMGSTAINMKSPRVGLFGLEFNGTT